MPHIGAMALTLSYSITSVLQMTVLCCVYYSYKNIRPKGMLVFLLKSALSLAIMVFVVNFIRSNSPVYQGKIYELAYLAGMFLVALFIYFGCSLLFKVQESRDAIAKLRNILRKSH
jgi:putative peptidoglycan lipid II flippase